jgi:hypothetical protein
MVRATRSSAALQSQPDPAEPSLSSIKKHNKKRKRVSNATDAEDHRTAKHRRSESKREDEEEPGTGDLPLNAKDAAQILDVLEM